VGVDDGSQDHDLPAGAFSSWVTGMQAAIRGERGSEVPCNGCTACCTSSQFVHISPDETDTLDHIPAELLFPAPRRPAGHVLLGYDERGHCPMLVDDRCSIYEHRPKVCRTYDCRIFPASGLMPVGTEKAAVARRAGRWRFSFPARADVVALGAVRAATAFLGEQGDLAPGGAVGGDVTRLAVLAVEVHDTFVGKEHDTGEPTVIAPDPAAVSDRLR
jgi:hypothetical protein